MRVGHYRALWAELKPGGAGEGRVRRHADGHDGEGAVYRPAALYVHAQAARGLLIALDGGVEAQIDALFAQVGVYLAGHVPVERGEHLLAALEQRHVHPGVDEVLRGLEADEPAADHDGPATLHRALAHGQRVLHRAQAQAERAVHSRGVRHEGLRSGGEDELVIALVVLAAAGEGADVHGLCRAVYAHRLGEDAHVHVEAALEALRRLERELLAVGYDAADVVRQAAVRVGDISGALEHHDLRALVQPPEPRRGGRAAGNAADNKHFHCDLYLLLQ